MKPSLLTAFFSIVFCLNAWAQSCLPNGITFSTQTEIDNFSINYPGCTVIEGNVEIQGDNITNLVGLGNLTAVEGILQIDSCNALFSLNGLENITTVGSIHLSQLPQITSLSGLESITSVGGGGIVIDELSQLTGLNSLENIISTGSLRLSQLPQLTSLNGLENITEVRDLILSELPLVTSLDGLANITSIGGGQFFLINLPQITSLSGVENIVTIGGDISLGGLPQVTSLNILKKITSVGGNLFLSDLPLVMSLSDLENITTIAGGFILSNFPQVTSLNGLGNITEVGGQVALTGLPQVTSLSGLENLASIGERLLVGGNLKLLNLKGLDSLKLVGGNVLIQYNLEMTNLRGLENLDSIGGRFTVSLNPLLSNCTVESLCHLLDISPDSVFIEFNSTGCNSPYEVQAECDLPPGQCRINSIFFDSQAEVDQFAINYPGCKEIIGDVYIYGPDISNLDSLSVLTTLGGALDINGTALANLSGLENLTSIGRDLSMESDSFITHLNALENVTHIGGGLYLNNLPMLTSLAGLENSTFSSGASLTISNNPVLASLDEIGVFTSVFVCNIFSNGALHDLSGLEHFDSLAALNIYSNPLLVNLEGLNNVAYASHCLISDNTALSSLSGLDNLKTAYSLYITDNPVLINLEGLNSLRDVDYFYIYGNATLSNLAQFNSLDSMAVLQIYENPALTNLNGLDSLKTLLDPNGGNINLQIENNAALTDIHSLQNLTAIERIQITGNQALSNCAIDPICSRLATEPDLVLIENNAPGCNDVFEIQTQCGGTIVNVTALIDPDGDCQPFGAPVSSLMVHFSSPTQSVFRQTSIAGTTRFILPAMDTFSLELPQILADKWDVCEVRYMLQSAAGNDSVSAFLLLKPLNQCPELTCNLALPSNFRSCFTTSEVQVSARNSGTVIAEAVRTAIVMPPVFELLATNPLASGQNGDTLFFELGDLKPFETGKVQLTVQTKCDTFLLGQTLCWEAFSTMDNPCPTTLPAFSEIKLSATCIGDTLVRFTLKNIGDAPTQGLHIYSIIRNDLIARTENFNLASQQSMSVDVPADSATYRMEATKFDDGTLTATALENCGGLTPGWINAFWLEKGPLEYDFDCRQVIGSFDPNQKTAVPTGVGPNHYITANRPIQYTIDFQNTGTDTAYRVLLRDVLPAGFDLNTFRPGFSSHPCTWEIRGNSLEILFFPIALPDSNVNEATSHGFFSFDLDQTPNLPDGTEFYNTASIIFDFNPAIGTNTVYHSIGKLTVAVDEPQRHADLWQLVGNPTRDAATFSALTFIPGEKRFELYDAFGRPVRMARFFGQSFVFQRDGMPAGVYFFRIAEERGRWFTGKIVIAE